jgi:hypothetical protein
MRCTLAIAGLAAGLGVGVGLLIGRHTASAPTQPGPDVAEKQPAPPADPGSVSRQNAHSPEIAPSPRVATNAPAKITIPLKSVYAITPQTGDSEIPPAIDQKWETILAPLRNHLDKTGISSAFLVPVLDNHPSHAVHRAMAETIRVCEAQRESDTIYLRDKSDHTPWLFLLIKTGINDRELQLSSIVVEGHRVSVSLHYTDPQAKFARGHLLTYAFWAPLPKSDSSEPYILTVSDNLAAEPLLVRRVSVVR